MKDEELILKAVEYCNDIPARVKDFLREEKPKEEPKPVFKVGDWVNWYYIGSTMILRIARIKDDFLWYKSDASCGERNVMAENCRLATPAEIESHLRKIAEGKGFVDGVKIRGLRFGREGIMKYQTESYHGSRFFDRYVMDNDCFNVSDDTNAVWESIYEKGKWAEIIPDKKRLPKTKQEFNLFLGHWNSRHTKTTGEFLDNYED